jgi:hypothetical protein
VFSLKGLGNVLYLFIIDVKKFEKTSKNEFSFVSFEQNTQKTIYDKV